MHHLSALQSIAIQLKHKVATIKRIRPIVVLLIFFAMPSGLLGQKLQGKREFRAVWVATINNIDWPTTDWLTSQEQQQEFIDLLEHHQQIGINALIVQVRPSADAFYPSQYEPWSEWLNGRQSAKPDPYYDPLAFMVQETHKRGMEFHAWINPFRAVHNINRASIDQNHISNKKPEWFLTYAKTKMFNPGLPEVRAYLVKVIADIVMRYEIDGVHFDDYFYPYPELGLRLRDQQTYADNKGTFGSIEDWRRHNVDLFIQQVSEMILKTKPYVKFGVSPFPVWRRAVDDSKGFDSKVGITSYDHLYADVRSWLEEGWIDYVAPQLYQHRKHKTVPFEPMVDWWLENKFNRHLYIGHAPYRLFSGLSYHWNSRVELPEQIKITRKNPEIKGNIYYSSTALKKNLGGFADSLRQLYYCKVALPPTMPWKDSIPPLAPPMASVDMAPRGIIVSWVPSQPAADGELAEKYIVYRTRKGKNIDINNPDHIFGIFQPEHTSFIDEEARSPFDFHYAVTALDRLKNESEPTLMENALPQIPMLNGKISPETIQILSDLIIKNTAEYFGVDE